VDTLFVALRVIVSLGVIVGLLWFVQRRLTKGRRAPRRSNAVTVVGRQGIGSKASVVVVDVDGKRFVLGVTEHAVSVLDAADTPAAAFALELDEQAAVVSQFRPRGRRAHAHPDALGGSILSPATWRQTIAAVRQVR
jgi:flagellar protein FliO/FliZ